jgi:hypothetical protein
VLLLLGPSCANPVTAVDAPKTLEERTLLALQEFTPESCSSLVEWLAENGEDGPTGYYFRHLAADDVSMLEHSDPNWDRVIGAGTSDHVNFSLAEYAAVATEEDQSFADPTYQVWTRTIVEGTAEGFLDGEGMLTENYVEKQGFTVVVKYHSDKEYQWLDDGSLCSRTIVPEEGWDEGHENGIIVGFTVETWMAVGDTVLWYNGQWSELETLVDEEAFGEQFWLDQLVTGTLDYMYGTETHATGKEWVHGEL